MGITNIGMGEIDTPDMVLVPNVIGISKTTAETTILASGLVPSRIDPAVTTSDSSLDGKVKSTNPTALTLVDGNSTVTYEHYLYVAPYSFTPVFGFTPVFYFVPVFTFVPPPTPYSFTPYSFTPRFR